MRGIIMTETTIMDYIDSYRDLDVSFEKTHLKEKGTTPSGVLVLLGDRILDKYRNDLEEIVIQKSFTTKEQSRYFCNPWVLSYDLYGSVEYWDLLMDINNMISICDFTRSNIKVFDSSLPELIETILSLEESAIDLNTEEIEGDGLEYLANLEESDNDNDIAESEEDNDDEGDD